MTPAERYYKWRAAHPEKAAANARGQYYKTRAAETRLADDSPKTCRVCLAVKAAAAFSPTKTICKTCAVEQQKARYRKNRLVTKQRVRKWESDNASRKRAKQAFYKNSTATPVWLTNIQRAQILEFYEISFALETQTGIAHQVDHIFPLRNRACRGLHVPWNLQVLTEEENDAKASSLPAYCHVTGSLVYNARTDGAVEAVKSE